jgi:hypothetical protein
VILGLFLEKHAGATPFAALAKAHGITVFRHLHGLRHHGQRDVD